MQTSSSNKSFPWLAIGTGACGLMLVFACIASVLLGAGGAALFRQLNTGVRQTVQLDPHTALITDVRGWVEVRAEDGDWQPVQNDQIVTEGQSVRTGELSGAKLVFNDGSLATLQDSSEILIEILDAPKSFGKRTILLSQTSGESSHKVAKNANKDSRYEVNTPSGTGQAKGTEFEVIITPEQRTYYAVVEGVVAVTSMDITVLVNPGYITYVLLGQPPLEPYMSVTGQGVVTQTGETWVIDGQSFSVTETTLITGGPQTGDWVLVSGHLEEDGSKTADRITLVRKSPTNEFILSGTVETIGDTQWVINGQVVAVDGETEIATGILAGATVKVEGIVLPGGVLQAKEITLIDEELGQPFEFTGVVETAGELVWEISGIQVSVNEETEISAELGDGDMVRVEGYIQDDGTWLAAEIALTEEDDEPTFEFTGTLEDMEPWIVSGISFETRDWTEIDDDLDIGDRVRVEGNVDENGIWIATEIERIDEETISTLVMIGTVFSMDPWLISGIPVVLADDVVIDGEIKVGMLVRVEMVLQEDGTWLVVKIEALDSVIWFPGCMDVVARVVSVSGSQVQLENWPLIQLDEGVEIEEGQAITELVPGSVVRMRVCFGDDMIIRITYIIIIEVPVVEPPDEGGKVLVCHKPDKKKGGHTLSIGRSALPAHLGHGDYEGACR